MNTEELFLLKKFHKLAEQETNSARKLFLNSGHHPENDLIPRTEFFCVFNEAVGKLNRVVNKLTISPDNSDIERDWLLEGRRQMIVIQSLLDRFYLRWDEMKDY